MMDENDWLRLTRYLADEVTEDERQETECWIAADRDRADLARRLRVGGERAVEPAEPLDVERAWGQVMRRKTIRSVPTSPRPRDALHTRHLLFRQIGPPRARRRWPILAAASVVLALGVGAVWQASISGYRSPVAAAAGPMRAITTHPRQMADVYLSDGTHVRLGAGSTLRFPDRFGTVRHVYLEGEGYFNVVHDPSREFAVHTARAVARDIGTQFSVRAYPGSASTEVVVADGAVALKPIAPAGSAHVALDSVVLLRSDLGRIDAGGVLKVTHRVNVEDHLAWMDGRLVFTDTPLREALPRLSRWYGVDLIIGDSILSDVHLTATLEVESPADALRRLSVLLDARTERRGPHGQTVVLYPKHPVR